MTDTVPAPAKREVANFVGMSPITVTHMRHPICGAIVSLCQYGGSISLNHSMTPEQALQLADMLIEAAAQLKTSTDLSLVEAPMAERSGVEA